MNRADIAQAYLAALGIERRAPSLSFLGQIAQSHVKTFAFASVGPRLGDDLPLDLASLFERIVVRRRGGYCFEQNGLAYAMLEELGFAVKLLLARVIYDRDIHPGLTHRITLVECEGARVIVDVGFGALGPRLPVHVVRAAAFPGAGSYRVAEPRTGEFYLQTWKDDAWFSLYRFELARYGQADCELGHFYSHKHPHAVFVNHLVVSRLMDAETRSLRNRDYWIIDAAGHRSTQLVDAAQLQSLLVDAFDVRVTEAEALRLFSNLP